MISRVLRVVLWSCLAVFIVFAIRSVIDDCAPPVEAYHKLVLDGKELWTQLHFDPERPPKEAEVEDAKEYRRILSGVKESVEETKNQLMWWRILKTTSTTSTTPTTRAT
eukprot:GHVS01077707.1.p1 GENE.GHVS01077707.1~~GHVS01077707.1.p1  ORF type:complete len:109 (-),score=25.86 GHVS01077707.1:446-772(-)